MIPGGCLTRNSTLEICESTGWRGQSMHLKKPRGGWRPVDVDQRLVSTSEWRVQTMAHRAAGMPGLSGTQTPLHTGTGADLRRLAEGKELVRPVPSGSVEHLLEHTGAHGETRRWNKELWRWEPKPKGHRRLRLEQQPPPEPEPELFTESELQRTFSEPTLQLDTRPGQERTVTEKELDHLRGDMGELQERLGADMLQQALARVRKKLVSKFAAMQAFHQMDVDCSGYLDKEEFAVALNRLGVKLGKAQSELVFGSIDEDASGEIDCEEFLEMVFDYKNDGDGDQSSNNLGLAKWSTWVAPKRNASELCGPAASAHLEDTYTVQRRQHDLMRRPASASSWPASILQHPGWRSSAEQETAAIAATVRAGERSLPQINPQFHPKTVFRDAARRGDDKQVEEVLTAWNNRWTYGRVKKQKGRSAAIAAATARSIRKQDMRAGLSEPPSTVEEKAKDVHFWMTAGEIEQASRSKMGQFKQRLGAAEAAVRLEQEKSDRLAAQSSRMDKEYFDMVSAQDKALQEKQAAVEAAAEALAEAKTRYGELTPAPTSGRAQRAELDVLNQILRDKQSGLSEEMRAELSAQRSALKAAVNEGERKLRAMWEQVDDDGNGELDRDELKQVLQLMGREDLNIVEVMMQIDKDRGGTVDYQEFEAWWDKQEDDAKDTLITKADERATALAQEPDRFWRDTPANAPFQEKFKALEAAGEDDQAEVAALLERWAADAST